MPSAQDAPAPALPLRAVIDIESALESRVDGAPAPVVVAGQRVRGTVKIEGGPGNYTMGSMAHRVELRTSPEASEEDDDHAPSCKVLHASTSNVIPMGAYASETHARHPFELELGFTTPSFEGQHLSICLLYTSPSPRDRQKSRMPSSA